MNNISHENKSYLFRKIDRSLYCDYREDDRPMWENREPRWKGSSTKGRRTAKQIKKDRKKKKMNKHNRH